MYDTKGSMGYTGKTLLRESEIQTVGRPVLSNTLESQELESKDFDELIARLLEEKRIFDKDTIPRRWIEMMSRRATLSRIVIILDRKDIRKYILIDIKKGGRGHHSAVLGSEYTGIISETIVQVMMKGSAMDSPKGRRLKVSVV